MKHKIYAQFLLLLSLVVSCSEVPTSKRLNNAADESATEVTGNEAKNADLYDSGQVTERFQREKIKSSATPEQRTAFLQAEQFFLQHDTAAFLAQIQQIKDYPLYPYLQSQWLRKNLSQTAEIEAFLTSYKSSRYTDLLRQDWLLSLAKNQRWSKFIQYYQEESDSQKTSLQCYFAWAQYNMGQQERALDTAQELWQKGTSASACNEIFSAFMQSPYFTEEVVWQRFSGNLRAKKVNFKAAALLKQSMSANTQKMADVWLKIANNQFKSAMSLWAGQSSNAPFYAETHDFIEQKLGLEFSASGDTGNAYAHLIQASHLDETARHTLIRIALREQNWQHVIEALEKLTDKERSENKWRYWQARALAETGKAEAAREIFAALAKKSDFYALLAADKLKIPYQVAHVPVPVTPQDMLALQEQDDFKIVGEWLILDRKDEALKQWWHTIKKSSPKQIMAAAKLAQYWQMNKLAAFTIAKAEYWQDLELRFPIAFSQEINTYATKHNVDPAIVFGLIRQESVFDELAGSQVGARGLMQIMPSTGRQIARQLQESWLSDSVLYEPDTNVRYGTFYYKQLLDKFNGQVALAAAGYNAGPGRVKNWRPDRPMAMDIWIETIPFNETRQYVSLVISNTLFYQHRMNRDVLRISDFMTDVQPS